MKKIIFTLFCLSFLILGCGDSGSKKNDADGPAEDDLDAVDDDEEESVPDDEQELTEDDAEGSDHDTDSTEPEPEPEDDYAKTCSEIFTCYISCRSEDCLKSCLKKGGEGEAEKFSEMYDCWLKKCGNSVLDDDFVSCAEENCKEKTESCEVSLKSEDAVKRFPKPYGKVTVSLASGYIITVSDTEVPKEALKGSDFAQGYIGSVATEPDYYSTDSFYATDLAEFENGKFLRTVQYHSDEDYNFFISAMLLLPENVEKGKVKIGLDDDSVGSLIFGVFNGETGEIVCADGFGEGELDIKAVKALPGSEGKLAVSGELDIFTPYNEPEKFDKFMSKLDKPLCAPKYPKFAGRLMYESTFASEDWELDETTTIIDAEKYFAFEGSGTPGEGDIYVDLKELVGLGYGIGPSSSGEGSSLSYFFKGTAETSAHPEGEPAIVLSVTGDEVLVGANILLSDIQKAYIKPLKYAPEVIVYKIISCSYDSCDVCILAGNKVENGVRVGEFQSSYYSKHDFDSTDTVASLSVAMSAELVDGEELLELYPEEQLCISME